MLECCVGIIANEAVLVIYVVKLECAAEKGPQWEDVTEKVVEKDCTMTLLNVSTRLEIQKIPVRRNEGQVVGTSTYHF